MNENPNSMEFIGKQLLKEVKEEGERLQLIAYAKEFLSMNPTTFYYGGRIEYDELRDHIENGTEIGEAFLSDYKNSPDYKALCIAKKELLIKLLNEEVEAIYTDPITKELLTHGVAAYEVANSTQKGIDLVYNYKDAKENAELLEKTGCLDVGRAISWIRELLTNISRSLS